MSDYEIGYGKPPKEHQFKSGQRSANPNGRPKGRKSKGILDKLNEKVVVDTKNGRRVKKTLREVLDHNLVKDAIGGDKHARSLVYRYREAAEKNDTSPEPVSAKPKPNEPLTVTAEEGRRILAGYITEVREGVRLGIFEYENYLPRLTDWARAAAKARGEGKTEFSLVLAANGRLNS